MPEATGLVQGEATGLVQGVAPSPLSSLSKYDSCESVFVEAALAFAVCFSAADASVVGVSGAEGFSIEAGTLKLAFFI